MLGLAYSRFDDTARGRFSFDRYGLDARAFVPLGSPQRVLALRAALLVDRARSGNVVPFFMQRSLGGSHTLRGFDSFRWRGPEIVLYQAEYRWEPLRFWDLDVFVDTGAVRGPAEGSGFDHLEVDWGFGTRFKTYRDVVVRLEIAFSNETTRYYVRGSTSF
jgi:hemolysin activation/secretion protein